MTPAVQPNTLTRALEALSRRIYDLERRLGAGGRTYVPHEVPFSFPGPLDEVVSPPWMSRYGGYMTGVIVLLKTAGTTATVIDVYVNDVSVATVTLNADGHATRLGTNVLVSHDSDLVTVGTTTAGDDAEDLDVILRFN